MKIEPQPNDVRHIVREMFERLGESPHGLGDLHEEIIVTDEGYNARTYRAGKLHATWMVEADVVQCRGVGGKLVARINLREEPRALRQDAA
jgi:hypothetical protein